MNRSVRLREDVKLAIALRQKLEHWLINTNPALVKQVEALKKKQQYPSNQ